MKTTITLIFFISSVLTVHSQNIFEAIAIGNFEQVKSILKENPTQLNAKNEKMGGISTVDMAFMVEMQKGKMEIAPYLIELGAEFDINKPNRFGYTPIDMAIVFGNQDAAEYFIGIGAEFNAVRQRDGKTPLINAITRGRESMARLLILGGADFTITNQEGYPPIYFAVIKGMTYIVRKISEGNSDFNFIDENGKTLLHYACLYGYYDIVEILIKNKAEISAKDNSGKSAIDYASMYGHEKIFNHLKNEGAKTNKRIPKNFGKSTFLSKRLDKGQAVAWYLNHRGWAVKTQNHFLVFDSEEFGVKRPDEPKLANGFLTPYELSEQNITAIYTAYHGEPGDPAYIHTIEDSVSKIKYVHNKLDNWRSSNNTVYMESHDEIIMDDLKITAITIQEQMPVLGYLCEMDGLTIFYSGFRTEDLEEFKSEIDFLAQSCSEIDIAFIPIAEPEEDNYELLCLIEKLNPKAIFPLDPDRREELFPITEKQVENINNKIKVYCAEYPGDHFQIK